MRYLHFATAAGGISVLRLALYALSREGQLAIISIVLVSQYPLIPVVLGSTAQGAYQWLRLAGYSANHLGNGADYGEHLINFRQAPSLQGFHNRSIVKCSSACAVLQEFNSGGSAVRRGTIMTTPNMRWHRHTIMAAGREKDRGQTYSHSTY